MASSGTAGTLTSSVAALVMDKTMLNSDVIKLDLTSASFGYQAGITNTLQMALKGTDFKTPKEIALEANTFSKVFKGVDFNNLLLALNLPFTENSDVELRVKSSISSTVMPVYSNALTLSARPFPLTTWLYVPGLIKAGIHKLQIAWFHLLAMVNLRE
ncbi:SusE domain-containing protein [Pedobacter steynii]